MSDLEVFGTPLAEGRTAIIYPWSEGRVLKLFRSWVAPEAIEHEYRINAAIAQASQQTGARLPAPGQVERIELGGRVGILFERVEGPSAADVILADPSRAAEIVCQMAEIQFAYHQLSLEWLPEAHDWLAKGIHTAQDFPDPYKVITLHLLARLPKGIALLHGDFHPLNVLLSPRGAVVIDWCNACRGDPLADVARSFVIARVGRPPVDAPKMLLRDSFRRALANIYLNRYLELSGKTAADVRPWILPMTVARWAERIENEREDLLQLFLEEHALF